MLRTILLVDKDLLFSEQMRQMFLASGFRVLCARDDEEAEEIFSAIRPDVAVMEVMLDHQDSGFILAWKLKKLYPDVPIVMVSSVTWHTDLFFSMSSPGARDWIKAEVFLDKPIRAEELAATVEGVL